jgi:acyl-CoA reductase-like NAD-dependent aldehyde dehydrogenase
MAVVHALGRVAALKLRQYTAQLAEFLVPERRAPDIDLAVARANEAQRQLEEWPEDRVDALLFKLAQAVAQSAEPLARMTVQETRIGNVPDKITKNVHASLGVCHYLQGKCGHGIIGIDMPRRVTSIASAAGVVFAIIPVTNPVATAIFKALIAFKARCALILSFHRACLGAGNAVCEIMQKVLAENGAPDGLLQWVRQRSSRETTARYMSHPGVALILATGGAGMVKAAYASGTPALGVGPGNAPVYIAADADIDAAARAIVASKPYDNGLICGAEHNLVADALVRDKLIAALEREAAAVLDVEEAGRFTRTPERAERFGMLMPASRILVNTPAVQGISGVTTGLIPSYTLGCGTFGRNSTTDNVSFHNLLNVKRLAHPVPTDEGLQTPLKS